MDNNIEEVFAETALELLGIAFPAAAYINALNTGVLALSDRILINKINRFLKNQDGDFNDKLKLCTKFNEDTASYEKNVQTLIYTLNAITEDDIIDVYANLFKSFLYGKIDNDILLRLSKTLLVSTKAELDLLKENLNSDVLPENPLARSLMQNGLFYDPAGNRLGMLYRTGDAFECSITYLGRLMVEHGLTYYNGYTSFDEMQSESI